ncbi:MAG: hypothetical protein QOI75_5674 [Pseudonocardiales bacterium]|nr:hypothetical protein [Pseudonocardiales bacterium]
MISRQRLLRPTTTWQLRTQRSHARHTTEQPPSRFGRPPHPADRDLRRDFARSALADSHDGDLRRLNRRTPVDSASVHQLRLNETNADRTMIGPTGVSPGQMAVAVGFEPTEACTSHAFEICDPVSGLVC